MQTIYHQPADERRLSKAKGLAALRREQKRETDAAQVKQIWNSYPRFPALKAQAAEPTCKRNSIDDRFMTRLYEIEDQLGSLRNRVDDLEGDAVHLGLESMRHYPTLPMEAHALLSGPETTPTPNLDRSRPKDRSGAIRREIFLHAVANVSFFSLALLPGGAA